MQRVQVLPTRKFRELLALHGGLYKSARAWNVQYASLRRWLKGSGDLGARTVATILERTGFNYDDLFEHEERKP